MSYLNNQKNRAAQFLGLALAAAVLACLFSVTSYSGIRSRFSGVAKTNGATVSLTQPQTSALKANGKIAFTSDRDGNREIYVMNNDGTGQVRMTTNPEPDDYPAWSPDGRKIAFMSGTSLKLIDADGTNQTQLTTAAVEQNCAHDFVSCGLSWSPDGTKIAFTDFADIVVINVDGSNRVTLGRGVDPSWSPDGSRIAFARNDSSPSTKFNIYTMNADGSDVKGWPGSGSGGNSGDIDPAWSPDGNRIAAILSRFPTDSSDLCVLSADGTRYTMDFVIERDHSSVLRPK